MQAGGTNRKRPAGPGANTGKEPHGNARKWQTLMPITQVNRLSNTPLHSALLDEDTGTASDMTVKNTST